MSAPFSTRELINSTKSSRSSHLGVLRIISLPSLAVKCLMNFPDFATTAQQQRCIFDPNPFHTYGRNGVEAACLRIPVVGSDRVFSYNKLFPGLCGEPYNFYSNMRLFEKAMKNPDKGDLKNMMDFAYEEVEYFNYKNSLERFNHALDICRDRGGYKYYEKVK